MKVTIKPKNGKPIVKSFSDPKEAIAWINSTTAEVAAKQSADGVQWVCPECGWSHFVSANTCSNCGEPRR